MHKDPEHRHRSAVDLATALTSVGSPRDQATRVVDAAPPPPVAHRPVEQLAATVPTVPAYTPPPTSPAPAPPGTAETKTMRTGMMVVAVVLLLLAAGGSAAAVIIALRDNPDPPGTPEPVAADEPADESADEQATEADDGDDGDDQPVDEPADSDAELEPEEPADVDPELQALATTCRDGDFAACDDLYGRTEPGSDLATFAATCAFRTTGESPGTCSTTLCPVDVFDDVVEVSAESIGMLEERFETVEFTVLICSIGNDFYYHGRGKAPPNSSITLPAVRQLDGSYLALNLVADGSGDYTYSVGEDRLVVTRDSVVILSQVVFS